MSFRVACVAGNTIHVDHTQYGTVPFSFRPTDDSRTIWPVGFSLEEIMKLAWRVRKWKITGTASWNFTDNSGSDGDTIIYDESAQDPDPFPPFDGEEHLPRKKWDEEASPDERFLVVSYGPSARYIATPRVGGSWRLIGSFLSFATSNVSLQFPSMYYKSDEELFWPFIEFEINMAAHPPRASMTSNLTSISSVGVQGRGSPVGTLNILGREIILYSASQLTGWPNSGLLTMSGAFTMEPKTWWPYANSQGNPVYDEDSGAQINDPFA